jgi:hypothetical protein
MMHEQQDVLAPVGEVFRRQRVMALLTTSATSVNGTNLVVWRAGDMFYWAASNLNPGELTIFAQSFADAS